MAHKKGVGSSRNGRESASQRLGVKIFGGQTAIAGNIIIRQRGTKFHPGAGVGLGKDHTIYAVTDGVVYFVKKRNDRTYVSVLPETTATAEPVKVKAEAKKKAPAAPKKESTTADDLTKVEGIGPKIAEVLNNGGINTYAELAETEVDKIAALLEAAGGRYKSHNPSTWPAQSKMAAEGKWDELKVWQDELDGGKE